MSASASAPGGEETLAPPPLPADRLGRPTAPSGRTLHIVEVLLRFLLIGLVMIPTTVIYVALCILLLPWRVARIQAGNLYGKVIGRSVQWIAGIVPEIHGFDRVADLRPAIYVMNHTSTIDMWIGMWLCPYRGCGVAKKEIVRIPVFGLAYLASGHLLLDRGNKERAIASMNRVQSLVAAKRLSIWMWPEGTRSRDGKLRGFKKGFVHLAIATRLPIVPVVAHNADQYWKGTWRITPGCLQMEILDPIDTSHWSADTVEEHLAELKVAYARALGPRQLG